MVLINRLPIFLVLPALPWPNTHHPRSVKKTGDMQHPCLTPLPIFTLFVFTAILSHSSIIPVDSDLLENAHDFNPVHQAFFQSIKQAHNSPLMLRTHPGIRNISSFLLSPS